jgi:hypothetical protein
MSETKLDDQVRLVAAIAYGEASTLDDSDEVLGIAFAVTNRARAWNNITVSNMLTKDPNYTYAANGKNVRFNQLKSASEVEIEKDKGMKQAVMLAKKALANEGTDPSNGAYWWDGPDLKQMIKLANGKYANSRLLWGFKYGDPTHNIFDMSELKNPTILYWQVRNKKTGKIVNTTERGRYEEGYISTAAHGRTIFWKYSTEYIKATGCKEYK